VLATYQRKSNIAGAVWFVTLLCLMALSSKESGGNIWRDGNLLPQFIFIAMGIAWFYALWAYARAKGHSGFWAAAGILTLLGLVILLLLPDKHKNTPESAN
jgi:asparagine N-glycosylation enzyme membrane subunit Stt3